MLPVVLGETVQVRSWVQAMTTPLSLAPYKAYLRRLSRVELAEESERVEEMRAQAFARGDGELARVMVERQAEITAVLIQGNSKTEPVT